MPGEGESEGHKGTLGGGGYVHCLSCDKGSTGVYIYMYANFSNRIWSLLDVKCISKTLLEKKFLMIAIIETYRILWATYEFIIFQKT